MLELARLWLSTGVVLQIKMRSLLAEACLRCCFVQGDRQALAVLLSQFCSSKASISVSSDLVDSASCSCPLKRKVVQVFPIPARFSRGRGL